MNGTISRSIRLAALGIFASSAVATAATAHWGYTGTTGPENWGNLSPEFVACSTGKNQSPINLTGMIKSQLPTMQVNYLPGGNAIINNGHSIQIDYAPGSSITISGHTFELKQFHFHTPSENTIEGKSYPMEAHFVHADANGNLAVIAVLYNKGEENSELAKAWSQLPAEEGGQHKLSAPVNAGNLIPSDRNYYRFNGSLTTPPCSEGVYWYVMKTIDTASNEQIEKFAALMHHANNRPVQPLNARLVLE